MASENKNENVMLTGQVAYFKKTGSMTDFGKIALTNQEVDDVYEEGYIAEGSTIGGALLENAADYDNTLVDMQLNLGEDFISDTEDYLVKTNAENISSQLSTRVNKIQSFVDRIHTYSTLYGLYSKNTAEMLDFVIPFTVNIDFLIEIKCNFVQCKNHIILDGGNNFKLYFDNNGRLMLNDDIINISNGIHTLEITQKDNILAVLVNEKVVLETSAIISQDTELTLDTAFTNQLYHIKVYNNYGILLDLVPKYHIRNKEFGLHDARLDSWYTCTTEIKLYDEYEYANIWGGALDLGYCPGPNTGLEIQFRTYSSQSGNDYRNVIGCYSEYSVANTMSFGMLIGSGSTIHATRNDKTTSWTNSGIVPTTTLSTMTLNKYGDGKFKSTGGVTFNVSLTGSATIQNTGKATLWLAGSNDLGRFTPLERMNSKEWVPNRSDIYIYNIKIYEGTELVRDYVVAEDKTGKKGMWDKIENKMYPAIKCSFSTGNKIN